MTKPCPKCHQLNPAEAAFCLNCASPIGQASSPRQFGGPTAGPAPSQKGLISLILAIAAFVCCGPFTGIPAAVLGWMELDAIKSRRAPAENKWMALVGLWGGIASTLLHIIGYVLWVLMGMLSASNSYGY
ncbi:MAG: DUF4190 domain-containing protein [Acidobacteriota bacterium]